jgi:tetratricopeptide (TPR) repeat protein
MAEAAQALLKQGEELLNEDEDEAALQKFNEAYDLFVAVDERRQSLQALVKIISTRAEKFDAEEGLRAYEFAQDKLKEFRAIKDIDGEICMVEQIVALLNGSGQFQAARKLSVETLERLPQHQEQGIDTTVAEAYLWMCLGQAYLGALDYDDAMNAATRSSEIFAELQMHEQETLALKLCNSASLAKKGDRRWEVEKQNFYLQIAIAGIDYGARYRNNNIILVNKDGTHIGGALALTCVEQDETWEPQCAYHAGIIDAGGHIGFASSHAPDAVKQAQEAAVFAEDLDPNAEKPGPSIPFSMDRGVFTARRPAAFYTTRAGTDCFMFSEPGGRALFDSRTS